MVRLASSVTLLVVLALFSGGKALAQGGVDAAAHLADANAAFEAGRFDDADSAIAAGLAVAPTNHKLLRLRGEIRLARRDFEGALVAYEAYLAAKPRGANRRKARKIIANLAASRTTVLSVTVKEGPANIYLDSKSIGIYCVAKPTCKKGMLPGRYRVFVERDGFHPKTQDVRLRLGKTEAITVALEEKSSPLTATARPEGATITIDGKPLEGAGPVEVAAGEHTIEATRDGFVGIKRTVTAARGRALVVDIALAEKVKVAVSEPGATLELDGTVVELTDGTVAVPSDGKFHELVAKADGFRDAKHTLLPDRVVGEAVTLTLDKIPAVAPPAPPIDTAPSQVGWSRNRKFAFIALVTTGAVASVAGAGIGWGARSKWNEVEERCPDDDCDQQGLDDIDEARSRANQSNLAFGLGVAALVGAGVVYLTAPSATETPSVSASVARDRVNIGVVVGF